jgi:hypothetical protein
VGGGGGGLEQDNVNFGCWFGNCVFKRWDK